MKSRFTIFFCLAMWTTFSLAEDLSKEIQSAFPKGILYQNNATATLTITLPEADSKPARKLELRVSPESIIGDSASIELGDDKETVEKKAESLNLLGRLQKKTDHFWVLAGVIMQFESGKLKSIVGLEKPW